LSLYRYVTCTLHCDVPAIAHRCDFDTANLVIDLTRRSFASMEKMALDANVVSKWPAVCSDIKTYRLPTPASPPKEEGVMAQSQGHPTEEPSTSPPKKEAMINSAIVQGISASLILVLFFI
ncbi:hypothetical protein ANCCAN_29643, partial [Ancylostoma caninum]